MQRSSAFSHLPQLLPATVLFSGLAPKPCGIALPPGLRSRPLGCSTVRPKPGISLGCPCNCALSGVVPGSLTPSPCSGGGFRAVGTLRQPCLSRYSFVLSRAAPHSLVVSSCARLAPWAAARASRQLRALGPGGLPVGPRPVPFDRPCPSSPPCSCGLPAVAVACPLPAAGDAESSAAPQTGWLSQAVCRTPQAADRAHAASVCRSSSPSVLDPPVHQQSVRNCCRSLVEVLRRPCLRSIGGFGRPASSHEAWWWLRAGADPGLRAFELREHAAGPRPNLHPCKRRPAVSEVQR